MKYSWTVQMLGPLIKGLCVCVKFYIVLDELVMTYEHLNMTSEE